jgi:hypothetical protein
MPSDCRDSCRFFPISERIEQPRIIQHIRSAAFAVTGSARGQAHSTHAATET